MGISFGRKTFEFDIDNKILDELVEDLGSFGSSINPVKTFPKACPNSILVSGDDMT